jgi:hypothetical protein
MSPTAVMTIGIVDVAELAKLLRRLDEGDVLMA